MPTRIVLDNGKYIIEYDKTNSYPKTVYRYGEWWRNVTGDNLIFWLCATIVNLQSNNLED